MKDKTLDTTIDTFFTCNRDELAEVFNELLSALQTEGIHNPGGLMSRNNDTAQANPEIHTLSGNLHDARDAIFPFYWGEPTNGISNCTWKMSRVRPTMSQR